MCGGAAAFSKFGEADPHGASRFAMADVEMRHSNYISLRKETHEPAAKGVVSGWSMAFSTSRVLCSF